MKVESVEKKVREAQYFLNQMIEKESLACGRLGPRRQNFVIPVGVAAYRIPVCHELNPPTGRFGGHLRANFRDYSARR
jgi:hypothetical protein